MKKKVIEVGKVLRPRGLKGELKTDVDFTVSCLKIDEKEYNVKKQNKQYLFLDGVDTIEKAETLRNKKLFAQVEIPEEQFFVDDIIGYDIVNESGKKIDVLKSVENYGASDIFVGAKCEFPFVDEFVVDVLEGDRQIVVVEDMLNIEEIK